MSRFLRRLNFLSIEIWIIRLVVSLLMLLSLICVNSNLCIKNVSKLNRPQRNYIPVYPRYNWIAIKASISLRKWHFILHYWIHCGFPRTHFGCWLSLLVKPEKKPEKGSSLSLGTSIVKGLLMVRADYNSHMTHIPFGGVSASHAITCVPRPSFMSPWNQILCLGASVIHVLPTCIPVLRRLLFV